MKDRRKKEIKNRKSFLPTLIMTVILWLTLGFLIYFVSPDFALSLPLFFLLVFFCLFFTFSIILDGSRRGLIISLAATLFVILRYFGIGNILNALLLLGIAVAIEIYFWYSAER